MSAEAFAAYTAPHNAAVARKQAEIGPALARLFEDMWAAERGALPQRWVTGDPSTPTKRNVDAAEADVLRFRPAPFLG